VLQCVAMIWWLVGRFLVIGTFFIVGQQRNTDLDTDTDTNTDTDTDERGLAD